MNVFLKRTEHLLQKSLDCNLLRCNFHLVFPVKSDKVAFERITLISAITGKPLYLPLQQRLLLAENSFAFASLCETSQVTYVTMVPRMGNETLRPLGVATGNASA